MKPVDMPGAVMYTADGCDPLPVVHTTQSGTPGRLTCWEFTIEELDALNRTGRIWLHTLGSTVPPVALTVNDPRVCDHDWRDLEPLGNDGHRYQQCDHCGSVERANATT